MKRVVTAAVLAPSVLYTVLAGPAWLFYAVVAAVAGLCYHEYCGMAGVGRAEEIAGVVAGCFVLAAPPQTTLLLLIVLPLLAMALAMRLHDLAGVLPGSAAQALGLAYIYGAWKTAFWLRDISPYWLAFGLLVNWIGDTGAYYVGRSFGRRKLAPIVSPGKTWEGAGASVVASVIFGALLLPRFVNVSWREAGAIAVVANVAGQLGDLAESAIKRGAGVKDSGTLLPGHGGMLDRVDSSLFSLPVLYGVLYFMHAGHGPALR
jgi:phosphatidate cytidylyltransferase